LGNFLAKGSRPKQYGDRYNLLCRLESADDSLQ
jgi:hypothetical protein